MDVIKIDLTPVPGDDASMSWVNLAAAAVSGPSSGQSYMVSTGFDWTRVAQEALVSAGLSLVVAHRFGEDAALDFLGASLGQTVGRMAVDYDKAHGGPIGMLSDAEVRAKQKAIERQREAHQQTASNAAPNPNPAGEGAREMHYNPATGRYEDETGKPMPAMVASNGMITDVLRESAEFAALEANPAQQYTIKQGDSFWAIAANELGEGASNATIRERTLELMEANQGLDPRRLQVGQSVTLPAQGMTVSDATLGAYNASDAAYQQDLAARAAAQDSSQYIGADGMRIGPTIERVQAMGLAGANSRAMEAVASDTALQQLAGGALDKLKAQRDWLTAAAGNDWQRLTSDPLGTLAHDTGEAIKTLGRMAYDTAQLASDQFWVGANAVSGGAIPDFGAVARNAALTEEVFGGIYKAQQAYESEDYATLGGMMVEGGEAALLALALRGRGPLNAPGAVRVGEAVPDRTLSYQPSSGVVLQAEPGRTTTILGSYNNDMKAVIGELGNVKSMDFGPKPGGFNVLNAPDELFSSLGPRGFWDEVNAPFVQSAISRNDNILMATPPRFDARDVVTGNSVLTRPNRITGQMELTGFGREYLMLRREGFQYQNGVMVK